MSLGLLTCHDGQDLATVDIVFVHGLGGHRETSWTHKSSNVFWPKDLLSSEIPASRILSFGYDSGRGNSDAPASQNRIRNHAEDLANDLNQMRELSQTTTRPIIFVAHSLGGLVVQDAIIQAKASADTDIRSIYEFSVAIAFIGTPHFGSELAKWETLRRDFRNILHSSNSEIAAVLIPDSEVLARIQADFHADLRDQNRSNRRQLEVFCFFEELGYGKLGLIVPMHSAKIPSYKSRGINKNHVEMTKFELPTDAGFRSISNQLRIWANRLQTTNGQQQQTRLPTHSRLLESPNDLVMFRVTISRRPEISHFLFN